MTRQISKGRCTFCHRELSKASMTRHVASCEQRVALQAEAGSHQKAQKTKAFHLAVQGYSLPMYWMHLQVDAGTTLATVDRFLRDTWLEWCGHLSVFSRELATSFCTHCIYEEKGYLCDACAKQHICGEKRLLPLVNSPRAGVCGYTGQNPAYNW